jgi:hypothetical protein
MYTEAYLIRSLQSGSGHRLRKQLTVPFSETYYQQPSGLPDFHEILCADSLQHVIG